MNFFKKNQFLTAQFCFVDDSRFPTFIGFYEMFELVFLSYFLPSLSHFEQFFRRLFADKEKKGYSER